MAARTSMARRARTTPMRERAIPTAAFTARPPGARRSSPIWAGMVTHANGTAERRASEIMLKARSKAAGRRITAGEDKAYDTADHVATLGAINVTPHVTQNNGVGKTGNAAAAPSTNAPRATTAMACRNRAA